MPECNNCKGTKIKSRRNYTHGKKSGSKTLLFCKDCGSTSIKVEQKKFRRRR